MFSLAILSVSTNAAAHPHLAQAWTAMSAGDGLKGQTGKESYLYEDCKEPSDTCMNGHVWNYGADKCIKYEVDRGVHSPYTGMYYVSCESVDCCVKAPHQRRCPGPSLAQAAAAASCYRATCRALAGRS